MTALNILLGYLAVLQAAQGHFALAAGLILAGSFVDIFDGLVARALHATSAFGGELDSLADVITSGIAPSVLVYEAFFERLGGWGLAIGACPLVFGALRLARFNLTKHSGPSRYFTGLPITWSAIVLGGFVLFNGDVLRGTGSPGLPIVLVLVTSALMVSTIPYETNAFLAPSEVLRNWRGYVFIAGLIADVLAPTKGFFVWAALYICWGVLHWCWLRTRNRFKPTPAASAGIVG